MSIRLWTAVYPYEMDLKVMLAAYVQLTEVKNLLTHLKRYGARLRTRELMQELEAGRFWEYPAFVATLSWWQRRWLPFLMPRMIRGVRWIVRLHEERR